MLRGTSITDTGVFANPTLSAVASEYLAIQALEQSDVASSALDKLNPDTDPRHRFLSQVQGVLADKGEATRA